MNCKAIKIQNENSCCRSWSCCSDIDCTVFTDDYSNLKGYNQDADLALGCDLPTDLANK
jgi:hypothetical protein